MVDPAGAHSHDPYGASHGEPRKQWTVHPWRLIPPLLVLGTVAAIWLTRREVLMVNHWAYPATLAVVGFFALLMVIGARPRRRPVPLPYPEQSGGAA